MSASLLTMTESGVTDQPQFPWITVEKHSWILGKGRKRKQRAAEKKRGGKRQEGMEPCMFRRGNWHRCWFAYGYDVQAHPLQ